MLLIAVAAGFLALLCDLAFLDQYLTAHPKSRPGSEHHLFSVVANALVSICAFASVVVFLGPISSRARRQRRSLHSNSTCGAYSSAAACAFGRGRHRRTGARTARRLTRTCVIRGRKNVVHRGMA